MSSAAPPPSADERSRYRDYDEVQGHICTLCRRRFATLGKLERHELKSELHRKNLETMRLGKELKEDLSGEENVDAPGGRQLQHELQQELELQQDREYASPSQRLRPAGKRKRDTGGGAKGVGLVAATDEVTEKNAAVKLRKGRKLKLVIPPSTNWSLSSSDGPCSEGGQSEGKPDLRPSAFDRNGVVGRSDDVAVSTEASTISTLPPNSKEIFDLVMADANARNSTIFDASDRNSIPDYYFLVLRSFDLCFKTAHDNSGRFPIGHPGLSCRQCKRKRLFFSDLKKFVWQFERLICKHLMCCCSRDLKTALKYSSRLLRAQQRSLGRTAALTAVCKTVFRNLLRAANMNKMIDSKSPGPTGVVPYRGLGSPRCTTIPSAVNLGDRSTDEDQEMLASLKPIIQPQDRSFATPHQYQIFERFVASTVSKNDKARAVAVGTPCFLCRQCKKKLIFESPKSCRLYGGVKVSAHLRVCSSSQRDQLDDLKGSQSLSKLTQRLGMRLFRDYTREDELSVFSKGRLFHDARDKTLYECDGAQERGSDWEADCPLSENASTTIGT